MATSESGPVAHGIGIAASAPKIGSGQPVARGIFYGDMFGVGGSHLLSPPGRCIECMLESAVFRCIWGRLPARALATFGDRPRRRRLSDARVECAGFNGPDLGAVKILIG